MDLLQLLIILIVVGICGTIAEWIVGFHPGGLLMSVIVGVIGAYFGNWLGGLIPVPIPLTVQVGTITFNLIWAIVGSVALLFLLHALRGGERRRLFGGRW